MLFSPSSKCFKTNCFFQHLKKTLKTWKNIKGLQYEGKELYFMLIGPLPFPYDNINDFSINPLKGGCLGGGGIKTFRFSPLPQPPPPKKNTVIKYIYLYISLSP